MEVVTGLLGGSPLYWTVLLVVNVPVYVVVARVLFFDDWGDFADAVKRWSRWDRSPFGSALAGEWEEDRWAALKLGVFVVACALVVFAEHWYVLRRWFVH